MDPERVVAALVSDGRVRVSGILNPMLWLCALGVAGLVGVSATGRDVPWVLIALIAVPASAAVGAFVYLVAVAPKQLRSEDYLIRLQALELVRDKGTRQAVADAATQVLSLKGRPDEGGKP